MAGNNFSPRVSIGVPTFNRPVELDRCLRELLAQTYRDIEIIVSDNASTDPDVQTICLAASQLDPRVRYIRQEENIGPQRNFQYVLDQARGEYFIWAADDDRRSPRYVEVLVNKLDANPDAVFSFCRFEDCDTSGNIHEQKVNCMKALRVMAYKDPFWRQICFFLAKEGGGKPHAIYGMIRREVLRGFDFPQFINKIGWHGSDVLMMVSLLGKGRLALSEESLMCITVDSVKHYDQQVPGSKLLRHLSSIKYLLQYSWRYTRVATPVAAICIALLMPIKFMEIFVEQFVVTIWCRIRRVCKRLF